MATWLEQPTRPTHRWTLPCAPHWSPIARATVGQPPQAVLGGVRAEEPAANGAAAPTNRHMRYDGVWQPRAPSSAPPDPRICTQCWLGRPTARFSPEAASRRETRTTHRLASHGPLPLSSVLNRPRPHVERCPTLRWPDRLETAPKKPIVWLFAWFLAVFSARGSPIAAAFSATRSPAARAHGVH